MDPVFFQAEQLGVQDEPTVPLAAAEVPADTDSDDTVTSVVEDDTEPAEAEDVAVARIN